MLFKGTVSSTRLSAFGFVHESSMIEGKGGINLKHLVSFY